MLADMFESDSVPPVNIKRTYDPAGCRIYHLEIIG